MLVNPSPASVALRNASFAAMAQHTSREDSIAEVDLVQTEGFKRRDPSTMAKFFRLLFRGSFYDPRLADSLTLSMDTSYGTKSRLLRYMNRDRDLAAYDLFPRLKVIRCPTLIVGSDRDMVIPEANERLHESIPTSSIIVLQHCGHFPYIEAPKVFFGALEDFLAKAQN
jgi:pimeloyl-ACP methyl ester carboxylesterase